MNQDQDSLPTPDSPEIQFGATQFVAALQSELITAGEPALESRQAELVHSLTSGLLAGCACAAINHLRELAKQLEERR
jgi:hypothetical protein